MIQVLHHIVFARRMGDIFCAQRIDVFQEANFARSVTWQKIKRDQRVEGAKGAANHKNRPPMGSVDRRTVDAPRAGWRRGVSLRGQLVREARD